MIPAYRPVHRDKPEVSSAQRLEMLELACADESAILCDDREIQRGGPSYTILTLSEYRAKYPNAALYFILGMDAFEKFDRWYEWQTFLDYVNLIVVDRPGAEIRLNAALQAFRESFMTEDESVIKQTQSGRVYFSKRAMLEFSATDVRANRENPEQIAAMLPEKVLNYIQEHELYR